MADPTSVDDLLGETPPARPPKRAEPRQRWSWTLRRLRSLRVHDIPTEWFSRLNGALAALIVGQALVMVLLLTWPLPQSAAPPSAARPSVARTEPAGPPRLNVASLAASTSRQMFQVEAPPPPAAPAPLSAPAQTVASHLSLIGIVTGTTPQAVIEDTQARKTYMLTVGQTFLEGLRVQTIEPGRVVLAWQGESIELRL